MRNRFNKNKKIMYKSLALFLAFIVAFSGLSLQKVQAEDINNPPTNISLSSSYICKLDASIGTNAIGVLSATDSDNNSWRFSIEDARFNQDSYYNNQLVKDFFALSSSDYASSVSLNVGNINNMPSGTYLLNISATDDHAGKYTHTLTITIADKRNPVNFDSLVTDPDVDHDFSLTYTANADFKDSITGISVNNNTLPSSAYTLGNGSITFHPGSGDNTNPLRTSGDQTIQIISSKYEDSNVYLTMHPGTAVSMTVTTQPNPDLSSGDAFIGQPVVALKDQYSNICTDGASSTATVTATAEAGTGTWTLGGSVTVQASSGVVSFTNITCTKLTAGTGKIKFTFGNMSTTSNSFTIPYENATLSPTSIHFDKYVSNSGYRDMPVAITLNDNNLLSVKHGDLTLQSGTDYAYSNNSVTIKKEYLQSLPVGSTSLIFHFSGGRDQVLSVTVTDSTPLAPVITPSDISFDKNTGSPYYRDVPIQVNLNGNILTAINNSSIPMSLGTDYIFDGNTCTIKRNYMENLPVGSYPLTFIFSGGRTQVLHLTVANTTPLSPGVGGITSGSPDATVPANNSLVEVNGVQQSAGTTVTAVNGNGQLQTVVSVDPLKLTSILQAAGEDTVVTIPFNNNTDVASGIVTGQMLKDMQDKAAILEIKTQEASYRLPASEINIDAVSTGFGDSVLLRDLKVSVEISKSTPADAAIIDKAVKSEKFTIVTPPIDFHVTCTYGDKTVEVNKFNSYVERTVAIPDGVDPHKITTGVVVEPNGTVRPVPTQIIKVNGKDIAVIKSATNSTYALIWNPVKFSDISHHKAKAAIESIGSKMIMSGTGNGKFSPNASITRAEFVAAIVRALGLKSEVTDTSFPDVKSNSWYAGYVATASNYGLLDGYHKNKFAPDEKITREQAMIMIANTMKLTQLNPNLNKADIKSILSKYSDISSLSDSSRESIATCLKTGIFSTAGSKKLAPEKKLTRADTAVLLENLLEKSNLI